MPEIISHKNPDGTQSYRFKKGIEFRKHVPKALAGTLAASAIGLIVWQCQDGQAQAPNLDSIPTPTSIPNVPTPEPTPTRTSPPSTPASTPKPYPWELLPTVIFPTQEPTGMPVPTRDPTSTPPPAPEPIVVPPNTPFPVSMPIPTSPVYSPITTEASISEEDIGTERKFTRCFDNETAPTTKSSIDIETTGIEINHVKFKGYEGFLKTEIKVPKTQKEIKEETEKAIKKAIKEKKDPNAIVIERKKVVSDGRAFDVDPVSVCADIKMHFRSGSDRDCYGEINANFKNRAGKFNGSTLESETLLQKVCISGVLEGAFEPSGYEYSQTENTTTATAIYKLHNPDLDTPQETKVKLVPPCSFLNAAGQAIVDNDTDEPISLNEPIKIPPKSSIWLKITSRMPVGISPIFPLKCNAELLKVLEK